MRDESDDSTLPKCLFCSERREGQRRTYWGGTHLSTKEKRVLFSSTTTITSKYSGMKRVGVFACNRCARRIVQRASLLTIIASILGTIGCAALAIYFPDTVFVRWGAIAGASLAGLLAVFSIGMCFFPNLDSWTSDGIIRDRATPLLRRKGNKGDSFFTEREYEMLFTKKPADRPETAEELLEGIGDEEEDRPRKKLSKSITGLTDLTRCPACAKATPAAKRCKWCQEPLP